MATSYQDFVRKAKERFEQNKKIQGEAKKSLGQYQLTQHAEYKMKQYGLSLQKIKAVIRNPKRKEEGIAPNTIAVMQPVSMKKDKDKEMWKQELWVMYQTKNQESQNSKFRIQDSINRQIRIISAWRYPGVSPERSPIPREILQELEGELL